MKKIIRILLGYIIAAITIGMLIPFMIVSMFLGKRRKNAFNMWVSCLFTPLINKVGQLVNSQISKDYEGKRKKINEDCELGYNYDIGNTDVLTSRSYLYV